MMAQENIENKFSVENLNKAVETITYSSCYQPAFLILSNFHLCFYYELEISITG